MNERRANSAFVPLARVSRVMPIIPNFKKWLARLTQSGMLRHPNARVFKLELRRELTDGELRKLGYGLAVGARILR
jgi:hypothetical protein